MPYHRCHECTEYIFHTLTSLLRCVWSHFQLTSVCPPQTDAFSRERLLKPVQRFRGLPSKASLGIVDFAADIVLQSVSHVFHTSSRNKPDGNYYFMDEINLRQQATANIFPPLGSHNIFAEPRHFLMAAFFLLKLHYVSLRVGALSGGNMQQHKEWRWEGFFFLNVPWVEHLIIPSALISRSNKRGKKISCPLGYNVEIYTYTNSNVTQVTIWTSLNSFIV